MLEVTQTHIHIHTHTHIHTLCAETVVEVASLVDRSKNEPWLAEHNDRLAGRRRAIYDRRA